jgi:hypothetical protein
MVKTPPQKLWATKVSAQDFAQREVDSERGVTLSEWFTECACMT